MNMPKPFNKKDQKRSLTSLRGSTTSVSSAPGKRSCINMEELMQFEAARQRALAQVNPSIYEDPFSEFVPHRIFLNHIDSFNGSHITEYLINSARSPEKEGEGEDEETVQEKMVDTDYEDEPFPMSVGNSTVGLNKKKKYMDSYQIMGSLEYFNNPKYTRPEGIFELLDNEKKAQFLDKLLTCGFIIYDITSDSYCHPKQLEEAKWVLESIVKRLEIMEKNQASTFSTFTHCRVFILISTLLTWAKTKPIDPEDPTLPSTERDFRKRRPHPNYKVHCEFEKKVIELGKRYPKNLKTIVIGSGIPYGHEEDILHFLFKMAWQDAPFLPIFKPGKNLIPVIHIDSLASVVHTIIENFPQKYRYIIATDPHSVTLKEIVKLLAKNLGNGRTQTLDREEALLLKEIKQRNYDMLTANVNVTPGFILDNMLIRWATVLPFAENIPLLITQFKTARELSSVKIFIHGPPASGKTFVASCLSFYYDIPHLHEKGVVEEKINTLKTKIKEKTDREAQKSEQEKVVVEGDERQDDDGDDDDEGEEENLESLKQSLKEIEENMQKNENKLDEEFVLRLFKEKLSSNVCQNKGYVIDGYPETMEQTKTLYAPLAVDESQEADGDEEQGGDISRLCNTNIMPAYVESLDASDEYLINQVIKFPLMNLTQYEEHEMCRRLTEYRALNTEDNTPLIFYDEMEVHPMIYNVENDTDIHLKHTLEGIIDHIGPPRNYGKELTLLEDIFEEKKKQNRLERLKELSTQRDEVKKVADERRQNLEKWMLLKNQELEMEEKALLLMGMPLRNYLMKYIFPCLTRGLVEVARLRPDDPVDFLSEFLFRENPEGKMFQPNYEETEDRLAEAIKEFESVGGPTSGSRSSKKTFSTEKSVKSDAVSRVTAYKCSFVTTPTSKSVQSKSSSSRKSMDKSSMGVCTCAKSPSLSTCSSDRTPSTASSCACSVPEPCEPCEPCDSSDDDKNIDPCKCPC